MKSNHRLLFWVAFLALSAALNAPDQARAAEPAASDNSGLPFASLPFVQRQVDENATIVAKKLASKQAAREEPPVQVEAETPRNDEPFPYRAIVTCSENGIQYDVLICFAGGNGMPSTNFELKSGDNYGLYQPMQIEQLGQRTQAGLEIDLARNFELTAQDASQDLILGMKIIDKRTQKIVYQKQVGTFEVIAVSGDELAGQ